KDVYQKIIAKTCVFEKSILQRFANCQSANKHLLAEREAINCDSHNCHNQCLSLHKELRSQARFSLNQTSPAEPLPHNKELRLQVGGLVGLKLLLSGADAATIKSHLDAQKRYESEQRAILDIAELIASAIEKYGAVEKLPYQELVRAINLSQMRKPRRRPKNV
ncbi:MAG: hypothetical protein KJO69_04430, partial [Gammaproteobacteria bacterium]|nr:hypothetical protein [Gammaproteobacteria bacterium]